MSILSYALREIQKDTFSTKNGKEVAELYRSNILDDTSSLFVIAYLLDRLEKLENKKG
jgi:hypothetical protein